GQVKTRQIFAGGGRLLHRDLGRASHARRGTQPLLSDWNFRRGEDGREPMLTVTKPPLSFSRGQCDFAVFDSFRQGDHAALNCASLPTAPPSRSSSSLRCNWRSPSATRPPRLSATTNPRSCCISSTLRSCPMTASTFSPMIDSVGTTSAELALFRTTKQRPSSIAF